MILILTNSNDEHSNEVVAALRRKGAQYVRFDTEKFPLRFGMTMRPADEEEELLLRIDAEHINLKLIQAIWYRRPERPSASEIKSAEDRQFIADESFSVLKALYCLLGNRFWINPFAATNAAEHKPYQLKIAREVGLELPRTLITNEPEAALDFFECCDGNVIYKTLTGYRREHSNGRISVVYTTRIRREDLVARAESVALAPCLFQEYIPKKVELRVTVIGKKVFAAEIDSQKSERTRDDWRRHNFNRSLYRWSELPEGIERKLQHLMLRLGLVFGCVDMIVTPDGRYVFLEINASGQWLWIEGLTGMPLLNYFTEMLIQSTPNSVEPVFQGSGSNLSKTSA